MRVAEGLDRRVAQPLPEGFVLELLVRTGEVEVGRLQADLAVPLEGHEGKDAADAGHHGDEGRAHGDRDQAHWGATGHVNPGNISTVYKQ